MGNKIYPIGIQNFESLRLDGYFYIDKTALIYQLVKSGSLFPREKGTFSRTGYGKTGKGLDKISHTAH